MNIIKNFDQLASTSLHKDALDIVQSGLDAINTEKVIQRYVSISGNSLKIGDNTFSVHDFKKIYIVGFGKASCDGIMAINSILKDHIAEGIAIDIKTAHCENPHISIYQGTHPKPSPQNLLATQQILELADKTTKDDLVICIVSGGGSALLCASEEEEQMSSQIYDTFLSSGGSITELNMLRKHISPLKGGGLAKLLYPARVVSLIFSDIPGGQIEDVASGPTFLDSSTLDDVNTLLRKYHLLLPSYFQFLETDKNPIYFEQVTNLLVVSNIHATQAMHQKAQALGYDTEVVSHALLDDTVEVSKKMVSNLPQHFVRIGAGEPALKTYDQGFGKGGRNMQLVLESLSFLSSGQVFISIASDGIDNTDAAGAIASGTTIHEIEEADLDYQDFRQHLNAYALFEKLNCLIYTGPTGSNVSDLMVTIRL